MHADNHLAEELHQLKDFTQWVENRLSNVNESDWFKPLAAGKWSIHQIIGHLYYWDTNSLEEMLPNMKANASLNFIDIQELNRLSEQNSASIPSKEDMIRLFIEKRTELIQSFEQNADEAMVFSIDGHPSNQAKFLHIFSHHDGEHRKQIEEFLQSQDN